MTRFIRFFLAGALIVLAIGEANVAAAKRRSHDRVISLEDAVALAEQAKRGSDFPIDINNLVLEELNHYLGRPTGRNTMRKALRNMERYRDIVTKKLTAQQLPLELMAVPIIESGYRNIPQHQTTAKGGGLWMFTSGTARNFGLRVDGEVDQRMNVPRLTDAACRYFSYYHAIFNDWLLVLLTYNWGEKRVYDAIDKAGTRNAWFLAKHTLNNGNDWLAKVVAAVIIMRNPQALR